MALFDPKETDFSVILDRVHKAMQAKFERNTAKRDALELQNILSAIKQTAIDLKGPSESVIKNAMNSEYYQLIHQAFKFQNNARTETRRKVHIGMLESTLFQRAHGQATVKAADDIFEEDLAAILAAGEFLGGNTNITLNSFLIGGQSATTKAIQGYKNNAILDENIDEKAEKLIRQLAEKEGRKASTEIRDATGKVDISGKAITLSYNKPLPFSIERLMYLMKDATISAKNYGSKSYDVELKKDFEAIGLHLGHTNLYKAITGALSEVQLGYKQQMKIFYRGMSTMLQNSHGYGDITKLHFNHLRFIYELRGSGLLDEHGLIMPVKFLIYNDPHSSAIYVRDTASLLLEILESTVAANNLFGEVTLAAARVHS